MLAIARHAQSTHNNKFEISLQYLKKEGRAELDFLHIDKHLQIQKVNKTTTNRDESVKTQEK